MGTQTTMNRLYRRLRNAELKKSYVQKLLPNWWDDRLASNRITYLHGLGSLVKHLGLPLDSLLDESAELTPSITAPAAFKRRSDTELTDFTWAEAIAISAAQHTVACLDYPYKKPSDPRPEAIRDEILRRGHKWVDLDNLLAYCWDHSIPVIYLRDFPGKKMDGLAVYTDDGPAIILTSGSKNESWIAFHLAHELGHIMLGHIMPREFMDDEKIKFENERQQEKEANDFAVTLLTGIEGVQFTGEGKRPSPIVLAKLAKAVGEEKGVSAGVVVLNYAYHQYKNGINSWPYAFSVLNLLYPNDDAPEKIKASMKQRVDWNKIPRASREVLWRLAEMEE